MFRTVSLCARHAMVVALAVMAGSVAASAQTVVDATTAEFQPSADHDTTVNGTPLVSFYVLQFFPVGSSSPSHWINMAKPAPGTDGLIRFPFLSLLTTPLVAGTTYQATVSAVGPGGTSASALSNPFMTSSACSPSISVTAATIAATASTGSVSVMAGTSCTWTAASNAGWLTVTSGASGTGPGSVGYSAAANPATAARTGTITIAGRTFTVTQNGVACTYAINPSSRTSVAAGESTTVSVTSTCAWTAASGAGWITVTAGASGTGNGTVSMTIAANPATAQRTGTVTIAGRTFTVTQQGMTCTYTVTPGSFSVPAAGVTNTLSIATPAGCGWTVSGPPSWVTIATTGQSGPSQLSYTVARNTGPARSATLTVAGQPVVVNQTSAPLPPPPSNLRIVLTGPQVE